MNSRSEFTLGNTNGSVLPIWAIAAYGYPPPAPIWMPENGNARYVSLSLSPSLFVSYLNFNSFIIPTRHHRLTSFLSLFFSSVLLM